MNFDYFYSRLNLEQYVITVKIFLEINFTFLIDLFTSCFNLLYNRQSEMYNFIRLPMVLMEDEIFESISIEAKVLYSYMLNRMGLSYKNGWIDEDGKVFIYYTIESIKDQFNCASEKANKLIAELDIKSGIGLIEKKRKDKDLESIIEFMLKTL